MENFPKLSIKVDELVTALQVSREEVVRLRSELAEKSNKIKMLETESSAHAQHLQTLDTSNREKEQQIEALIALIEQALPET
ncbi:hypothetical protein CCP3SC1AL1_1870005 [Gammaproteobacteria bacterium]